MKKKKISALILSAVIAIGVLLPVVEFLPAGAASKGYVFSDVKTVDGSTFAIKKDGSLWAWGDNYSGLLGLGDEEDRLKPELVMEDVAAISISMGGAYALKKDGSLWGSGDLRIELNDGLRISENRLSPVHIMDDVIAVAAGNYHVYALKSDHSLWGWRSNNYGQLLTAESSLDTPTKLMDGVKAIGEGAAQAVIIKEDGSLWVCGQNDKGQLGLGDTENRSELIKLLDNVRWAKIDSFRGWAILEDNSLWCWGDGGSGGTGLIPGTELYKGYVVPTKAMDNVKEAFVAYSGDSYALLTDNSLWFWNGYPNKTAEKIMDGVAHLTSDGRNILITLTDGRLFGKGSNYSGELGTGSTVKETEFIEVLTAYAKWRVDYIEVMNRPVDVLSQAGVYGDGLPPSVVFSLVDLDQNNVPELYVAGAYPIDEDAYYPYEHTFEYSAIAVSEENSLEYIPVISPGDYSFISNIPVLRENVVNGEFRWFFWQDAFFEHNEHIMVYEVALVNGAVRVDPIIEAPLFEQDGITPDTSGIMTFMGETYHRDNQAEYRAFMEAWREFDGTWKTSSYSNNAGAAVSGDEVEKYAVSSLLGGWYAAYSPKERPAYIYSELTNTYISEHWDIDAVTSRETAVSEVEGILKGLSAEAKALSQTADEFALFGENAVMRSAKLVIEKEFLLDKAELTRLAGEADATLSELAALADGGGYGYSRAMRTGVTLATESEDRVAVGLPDAGLSGPDRLMLSAPFAQLTLDSGAMQEGGENNVTLVNLNYVEPEAEAAVTGDGGGAKGADSGDGDGGDSDGDGIMGGLSLTDFWGVAAAAVVVGGWFIVTKGLKKRLPKWLLPAAIGVIVAANIATVFLLGNKASAAGAPVSASKAAVVEVTFAKEMKANLSVPVTDEEDREYLAVVGGDGIAIFSKFNPVTRTIDARIPGSGTYTVKNMKKDFSDIEEKSDEMQEAIRILATKGVMDGLTETEFSPDLEINRAEFFSSVLNVLDRLDVTAATPFEDVNPQDWFYAVSGSAYNEELTSGTGEGLFAGLMVIPKDQMVVLSAKSLVKQMGYEYPEDVDTQLGKFGDASEFAGWSRNDIALAARENMVPYRVDGLFGSADTMTRGDAAIMLFRMYRKIW